MTTGTVDRTSLENKVKDMYSDVARNPHGEFHFEMGRAMAERLGYASAELDRVPSEAIDSFAGVGHFFHLAALEPGEHVVDLGSGSGMDSFIAALKVQPTGRVVGIDMTDAQLEKARRAITRSSRLQRLPRDGCARIVLVGYTNAGKTSLMNALTSADTPPDADCLATDRASRRPASLLV